jgi:probable rRNA maturation factor
MLKNLLVNYSVDTGIKKKVIHEIVKKLRDDRGFKLISVDINFVESEVIHDINKEYLNHDFSTDIITFNYGGSTEELEGEIFISVKDAELNALKYKVNKNEELLRLVVHGILHLIGYDDLEEEKRKEMKKIENYYVEQLKQLVY